MRPLNTSCPELSGPNPELAQVERAAGFHEAAEHAGRNIVGKSAQNRVQVLFHRCGSILQLLFVLPTRAARPLPAKIFNEGRRLGMRNRQHSSR